MFQAMAASHRFPRARAQRCSRASSPPFLSYTADGYDCTVAVNVVFRYCPVILSEIIGHALSAVPQRGLRKVASQWFSRLSSRLGRDQALAMPDLRKAFLCGQSGCPFRAVRALPSLRKFQSAGDCADPRGARHLGLFEALPRIPRLSLRYMPRAVLQHPAVSPYLAISRSIRHGAIYTQLRELRRAKAFSFATGQSQTKSADPRKHN